MGRVNSEQLRIEVEKQLGQVKAYRRFATQKAQTIFENAKERLLQDFDDDPVSQEINEGPGKLGSEILPAGYGNLFSFIGFYEDDKPIEELRAFLEREIKMVQTPILTTPYTYVFRVWQPSKDEIAAVTPMPFGTANSWAIAIEEGIPGFNKYLFDLERDFASSRSGPAIQTDDRHILRTSDFQGEPYLFEKLFPAFAKHLLN